MKTPELLEEIIRLTREARRAQEREEHWRQSAYRVSSGLSLSLRQARNGDCRHERALLESDAAHGEAAQLSNALEELRGRLAPTLLALPPSQERAALRYCYLEGLTCAQIGERMHYSRAHVYRLLDAGRATLTASPQQEKP